MYKRILITLDGSKIAEESIPVALELGKKLGSEISLLQVCEVFALMKKDKDAEAKVLTEKAVEYLKCIQCKIEPEIGSVQSVVLTGKPGEEICRYAKENGVDLIVMTTHGLGGFTSWAIGSVSEQVVKGAAIPVLLLSAKSEQRQ